MVSESTPASSLKVHTDPSTEAVERKLRINARRQRIEARLAFKDDALSKKQLQVDESQSMSRAQQKVTDSFKLLDRRKVAGIQHVTSVRVEADVAENRRRIEEEERRHKRMERLQQEATMSGPKNTAIEMRWADLFEFSMPQELHNELELQNHACAEILASKDRVISEFQNLLKVKDEEYVSALKTQAEGVEKLIERMNQQYREMQNEYETQLEQMEDAFVKDRKELIANNKHELDSQFERRREMEIIYMKAKHDQDEQYLQEIEHLRVRDTEDYSELKIKLETNLQTLEQQLEEMRATYQLNTEKLEYNYRVLTERDTENSVTLGQQKRKLTRLKEALATLITKYKQTEARNRHKNEELTGDYQRLTEQYRDLQKKYAHFESSDRTRFDEVWQMHEEEATHKIDKLLEADRIIHEQQLGLTWRPPVQSIQMWSQLVKSAAIMPFQNKLEIAAEIKNGDNNCSSSSDQDNRIDESVATNPPIVRKVSAAKLKYMLKVVVSEAEYLVKESLLETLRDLPNDEAELVKADMVMRALGIDTEEEIEKLMGYFFEDPCQEVQIDSQDEDQNLEKSDSNKLTALMGLKVKPENIIREVKRFVEEMNAQKRATPVAQTLLLFTSSNKEAAKKSGESNNSVGLKTKTRKAEKDYWVDLVKVFPAQKVRVMAALEKGLTHYNTALLRRKELVGDVTVLKAQNVELKALLQQYLVAPINDNLIVPPTQMQLYQ